MNPSQQLSKKTKPIHIFYLWLHISYNTDDVKYKGSVYARVGCHSTTASVFVQVDAKLMVNTKGSAAPITYFE